MRAIRNRILSTLFAAVLVASGAVPAFAATPPTTPVTVYSQGFETSSSEVVITPINIAGDPSSAAYWGRITNRRKSGSYGLYCAGAPTNRFPTYPKWTRGLATIDIADLADYYSSSMEFWYTMPSLGAADGNSFVAGWREYGTDSPTDTRYGFPITADNSFSQLRYSLSSPMNVINLSRRSGRLVFQFADFAEGPTQSPSTGQGATMDDLKVLGYKYGPVRDVAATVLTDSIRITWAKPYRSTYETSIDERTLTYRVWRSPAGANDWTELTSDASRLAVIEYEDTSVAPNTPYDYTVQAWDPIPGIAYGEWHPSNKASATLVATVEEPSISVFFEADKTTVSEGEDVTFTYTVLNNGNVPLSDVRVEGTVDGTEVMTGDLPVGEEWQFSQTDQVYFTGTYGATAYGYHDSTEYSDSADPVTVTVVAPALDPPPTRISGDDRFETAVKISQQAFPDSTSVGTPSNGKAVVIANGLGWADALPASALAGAVRGPLLLVTKDDVPSTTVTELKRLKSYGVDKVYVVGGDPVVGSKARSELSSLGFSIVRVEGSDRYATAEKVAEKTRLLREGGGAATGGTAFIATGLNFPDALAASSLAARMRAPILLTTKDSLPAATKRALAALKPDTVVVCGSTDVVSDAVKSALGSSTYGSPKVIRKSGPNRYDTAKALVDYGKSSTGAALDTTPGGIFLATGLNYPDALSGGVLAGIGAGDWKPLMLTDPYTLSPQAEAFIKNTPSLEWVSVLGGKPAVDDRVKNKAISLL